jgi:pimeloyl-ACP methyl ester carboxylesterase
VSSGIGKSDKPLMRYSTSEMAKDLIELIDHLGWGKERELNIVGVSMGGMIAQELVSRQLPGHLCIQIVIHGFHHLGSVDPKSHFISIPLLNCSSYREYNHLLRKLPYAAAVICPQDH